MKNKKSSLMKWCALPLISGALLLSGCGSNAVYVDSGGPETVVSLDSINIQDWSRAADEMVQSLLNSGVLEQAPRQPAVLAISRIINNTTQVVDTDMLTGKIRADLNRTGKVLTSTTVGLGGRAQDPLAREAQELARFSSGDRTPTNDMPDYTLSGKIMEDQVRAGRTRQTTYIFQLALTDVRRGLAVWEDERQITKQGTRPSVGW